MPIDFSYKDLDRWKLTKQLFKNCFKSFLETLSFFFMSPQLFFNITYEIEIEASARNFLDSC